ncbi:F-box DNA helicase 1 [Discoglossus pictus]
MRRQKRLTQRDCQELSHSREGSYALTQPFIHRTTSRDVNLGLYPRSRNKTWVRGRERDHFQSNNKTTHLTPTSVASRSQRPVQVEEMDFTDSDDELFSSQMEENPELFDAEPDIQPVSSRKRSYSSTCSQNTKQWKSMGDDNMASSSSFDDQYIDDEEMDSILNQLPDSCYGLLGITGNEDKYCEHINQFPDELLQCIFGFLPVVDLYKNVSLVCRHWKTLVSDPLFIPWKKLYHQYLGKEAQAVAKVKDLLINNGIRADDELCVLNLVRYFATFECSRTADPCSMLDCLKKHHLYPQTEACVTQRLPELANTAETVNAWAVLAVIVLLSNDVSDIQRLILCLKQSRSTLRLIEIIESLYCLATLLYAMRDQKILISNRIHYNVFYSLYLMENCSSNGNSKNSTILNLTNEQQQILNHDIAPGQVMKIMAFAGTGKTSTLIRYAEKRPHLQFLYVTFNKSIAVHARNMFPYNVTCKTFHSLAYEQIGKVYQQRKKLNPSQLTPYTVNFVLPEGKAGFVRAKLITRTLHTFFSSADETISKEHAPIWYKNTQGLQTRLSAEDTLFCKIEATKIWERMQSLDETRTPAHKMTHDGYLKLWQLRRPQLSSFDAIFVDEAQDCTPAIMQVVLSQTCGKIFVGDPHQQIYTFRGAVNALCEVPHTHIFYLTQSFRFGAEIAYVGATILDVCKKVKNKTLVGGSKEGSIQGCSKEEVAILCRTNCSVFEEAVRVTEGENPSRIHIIGGPENFGLNKILSIWILFQPEAERRSKGLYITDKSIALWLKHGGFSGLKKYATSAEDKELEAKIAIVEKYNIRIPELVRRIENCHTPDAKSADYILGTVHKAKGMEFATVHVTDDFVKVPCARHNLQRLQIPLDMSVEDEWNLLYVAVTRAKKHLVITKSVENLLTLAGEYFLRPELTSSVLKEGPVMCALQHCKNSLLENTVLTMKKTPIIYSDRKEDKGGYFCHACVCQRLGQITYLTAPPDMVESMHLKNENVVLPRHVEVLFEVI